MTVYNNIQAKSWASRPQSRKVKIISSSKESVSYDFQLFTNLFLAAVFASLLFVFVFKTNAVTAGEYKIKIFNEQISSLNGENSILAARQSEIEKSGFLAKFAAENNMVEAKNIIHIFDEKDVAMKK